ncbi:uncharacterized protein LOC115880539 [Sitophilus oryzae]|uniref:Uncharacterized protein LOC115880539 n=1 Tax=Sitophilus oryzae TaxID=7048 RepID=A0A6J2XSN2_SITOR|nr:uncharacterized protein LOC115880539 [Sitophilus oryzae]
MPRNFLNKVILKILLTNDNFKIQSIVFGLIGLHYRCAMKMQYKLVLMDVLTAVSSPSSSFNGKSLMDTEKCHLLVDFNTCCLLIMVYNGTIGVRSQQVVLVANNILWRTSKNFKWNESCRKRLRGLYLIAVRVDAVLHQCELKKLMVMDILTATVTTQRTSCSFEGKFLIGYRKMSVVSGCKVNRTRVGLDICCLLIMAYDRTMAIRNR